MTETVITAWDAYSPLGHGAQAHLAGLRAAAGHPAPPRPRIDGFEVREVLGRTGTRAMDRAAGLAVATTRRLLGRVGTPEAPFGDYLPDEIGLVLGVNDGIKSVSDFVRDSWTRDKPYDVDPSHIPRTLMNYAAGQCAIWHGIKGPNATICGSHATGLLALNYARRLQHNGHAKATVWGAVDEYSDDRAAVESARSGHDGCSCAEGCVMFLLESAGAVAEGRSPLAAVIAVEFGVWFDPSGIRAALVRCLRRALERSGGDPSAVYAVSPSARGGPFGAAEHAAVAEVFADVPMLTATAEAVGNTGAVSTAFQIVELLTHPGAADRIGVATTVDAEGRVGCALFRIC